MFINRKVLTCWACSLLVEKSVLLFMVFFLLILNNFRFCTVAFSRLLLCVRLHSMCKCTRYTYKEKNINKSALYTTRLVHSRKCKLTFSRAFSVDRDGYFMLDAVRNCTQSLGHRPTRTVVSVFGWTGCSDTRENDSSLESRFGGKPLLNCEPVRLPQCVRPTTRLNLSEVRRWWG